MLSVAATDGGTTSISSGTYEAGNLSCDCWGYIGHRKCKHIKEVKDSL
jgi:hypothetical protein